MTYTPFVRLLVTTATGLCLVQSLSAATVFTSSAAFHAALGAAPTTVEGFETYPANSPIPGFSILNGISYDAFPAGTIGRIDSFYNRFDNQSLALERDGVLGTVDFFNPGDGLALSFTTPVYAFGLFFNVGLPASPSPNFLTITTPAGLAASDGSGYDTSTFVFLGLVSNVPFSSAVIGSSIALPTGFNLDNLTYTTTPIPEPAGAVAVGALALAGVGFLRRRTR